MGAPSRTLPSGRVALLFSDIEGSTALLTRLGAAYESVLDAHDRIMRAAFADHGGHEFSNEGDAFGAAFADPTAAATAALRIQTELAATTWPESVRVRVRMGLHYGEPRLRGHDYWGEDVHFAARVAAAAHGGQVIMSAAMRATVPDDQALSLGHHGLKDFPTPRELFQLHGPDQEPEAFPPPRTLSALHNNVPTITTPIIGRDEVTARLVALLTGESRLVTVIGPGGMGKTRLAVAVGEALVPSFEDGVAFVALSPVDAGHAPTALAEAVGAPRGGEPEVAVREHLRHKRLLVILDNCEHVAEAAAGLAAGLLESCPDVRVLATAQVPLGPRGETVHRLEPLSTGAGPTEEGRAHGSAVEMLVARARARGDSVSLTGAEQGAVERLCELLDGLPLAIELAAARIRVFGVERLVRALERDVDALGSQDRDLPDRQRSLRAALEWTLSLLTPEEHDLFVALAAFAESWSIEEAEQMLAGELDEVAVWDALSRLVDASLVLVKGDGRFAMSERVRRHAVDLLDASDGGSRWRLRHAEVVGQEARDWTLQTYVDYRRMLANVADLLPELLQALAWTKGAAPDAHRHVVGLTAPALAKLGHLAVVVDDIERMASEQEPVDYDDAALAQAVGLVHAMRWSTDVDGEVGAFRRAAGGFARFGDPREVVAAHTMAAVALEASGLVRRGLDLLEDVGPVTASIADPRWREEWERRAAIMYEHDEASLAHRRRVIEQWGVGTGSYAIAHRWNEGIIAALRGDHPGALAHCERALAETPSQQLYMTLNIAKCAAWLLALLGEDATALEVCSAIDTVYRARTGSEHGNVLPDYEAGLAAAAARLGPEAAAAARGRGTALSYEDLVHRTLQETRAVLARLDRRAPDAGDQVGSAPVDQGA